MTPLSLCYSECSHWLITYQDVVKFHMKGGNKDIHTIFHVMEFNNILFMYQDAVEFHIKGGNKDINTIIMLWNSTTS